MAQTKKQRISNLTAGLMIFVALTFDLVGIIPVVNILTELVALLVFGLWFYLLGVGFTNPRRFTAVIIGSVIELIPIISILPGLTVAVIICIVSSRTEDVAKALINPTA